MGENISDVDLERFLRRRDRISREYLALGSEGPAAVLDARVLEEARLALERDASASQWRRRRWPMITALAATVLLSLGLILRVALESDQAVYAPTLLSEPETSKKDDADFALSGAEQPAASPPARTADPIPPELPRPLIEGEIRRASERSKLAVPASGALETRAQSREQFDKRSDAAARPEVGLMKEEAVSVRQSSEMTPAAVAEPPAPASAPAGADAEAEADATEGFVPARDAVNAARAAKAPQKALKSASTMDEVQSKPDPEVWLEQIDRLRANGQVEDANREMERFLAVYPHYLEEHPRPPAQ